MCGNCKIRSTALSILDPAVTPIYTAKSLSQCYKAAVVTRSKILIANYHYPVSIAGVPSKKKTVADSNGAESLFSWFIFMSSLIKNVWVFIMVVPVHAATAKKRRSRRPHSKSANNKYEFPSKYTTSNTQSYNYRYPSVEASLFEDVWKSGWGIVYVTLMLALIIWLVWRRYGQEFVRWQMKVRKNESINRKNKRKKSRKPADGGGEHSEMDKLDRGVSLGKREIYSSQTQPLTGGLQSQRIRFRRLAFPAVVVAGKKYLEHGKVRALCNGIDRIGRVLQIRFRRCLEICQSSKLRIVKLMQDLQNALYNWAETSRLKVASIQQELKEAQADWRAWRVFRLKYIESGLINEPPNSENSAIEVKRKSRSGKLKYPVDCAKADAFLTIDEKHAKKENELKSEAIDVISSLGDATKRSAKGFSEKPPVGTHSLAQGFSGLDSFQKTSNFSPMQFQFRVPLEKIEEISRISPISERSMSRSNSRDSNSTNSEQNITENDTPATDLNLTELGPSANLMTRSSLPYSSGSQSITQEPHIWCDTPSSSPSYASFSGNLSPTTVSLIQMALLDYSPEYAEEKEISNESDNSKALLGGLYNEGNTCFINSVIQSMASLDSLDGFLDEIYFARVLTSTIERSKEQQGEEKVSLVLRKLVHSVNRKSLVQHAYSAISLERKLNAEKWFEKEQGDAEEWFRLLLVELEKDYLTRFLNNGEVKTKSETENEMKQDVRITTSFDGEIVVRVVCQNCGHSEGIKREIISGVALSLGAAENKQRVTLEELLEEYTSTEHVHGVECFRCTLLAAEKKLAILGQSIELEQVRKTLRRNVIDEKDLPKGVDRVLSDKTKQCMFTRQAAQVLAIHVNRSVFDRATKVSRKSAARVAIPEVLDMSRYIVNGNVLQPNSNDPMMAVVSSEVNNLQDVPARGSKMKDRKLNLELETDTPFPQENDSSVTGSPATFPSRKSSQSTLETSIGVSPSDPSWNVLPWTSANLLHENTRPTHWKPEGEFRYRLKSFIGHQGSHEFGHYQCYRVDRENIWYHFNDEQVSIVTESTEELFKNQGESVFMLFYELERESFKRLDRLRKQKMWLDAQGHNLDSRLKGRVVDAVPGQSRPATVVANKPPISNISQNQKGKRKKGKSKARKKSRN